MALRQMRTVLPKKTCCALVYMIPTACRLWPHYLSVASIADTVKDSSTSKQMDVKAPAKSAGFYRLKPSNVDRMPRRRNEKRSIRW